MNPTNTDTKEEEVTHDPHTLWFDDNERKRLWDVSPPQPSVCPTVLKDVEVQDLADITEMWRMLNERQNSAPTEESYDVTTSSHQSDFHESIIRDTSTASLPALTSPRRPSQQSPRPDCGNDASEQTILAQQQDLRGAASTSVSNEHVAKAQVVFSKICSDETPSGGWHANRSSALDEGVVLRTQTCNTSASQSSWRRPATSTCVMRNVEKCNLYSPSDVASRRRLSFAKHNVTSTSTLRLKSRSSLRGISGTSKHDAELSPKCPPADQLHRADDNPTAVHSNESGEAVTDAHFKSASNSTIAREPSVTHIVSYMCNQDRTRFICATTTGFRTFKFSPLEEICRRENFWCPTSVTEQRASDASAVDQSFIASMFYCTNIVAFSVSSCPNIVHLWDESNSQILVQISVRKPVAAMRMCRDVIAIATVDSVYVYSLDKVMPLLMVATGENSHGVVDLQSPSARATDLGCWLLACPHSTPGSVQIYSGEGEAKSALIEVSSAKLSCLRFNSSSTLLAVAAINDWVIRIVAVNRQQIMYSLRWECTSFWPIRSNSPYNGDKESWTRSAVCELSFRQDDKILAAASTNCQDIYLYWLDPSTAIRELHHMYETEEPRAPTTPPQQCDLGSPALLDSEYSRVVDTLKYRFSALYSQGRETASDILKALTPAYFSASPHWARCILPKDSFDVDLRYEPISGGSSMSPTSSPDLNAQRRLGPMVVFDCKNTNRLHVVHYNGMIYEFQLPLSPDDPNSNCAVGGVVPNLATTPTRNLCDLVRWSIWFQPRAEFSLGSDGLSSDKSNDAEVRTGEQPDIGDWQIYG